MTTVAVDDVCWESLNVFLHLHNFKIFEYTSQVNCGFINHLKIVMWFPVYQMKTARALQRLKLSKSDIKNSFLREKDFLLKLFQQPNTPHNEWMNTPQKQWMNKQNPIKPNQLYSKIFWLIDKSQEGIRAILFSSLVKLSWNAALNSGLTLMTE